MMGLPGPDPKGEPSYHEAYQSVGIVFGEPPSDAAVEYMMKRARQYQYGMYMSYITNPKPLDITGYRVLKIKTEEELIQSGE